MPETRVGLCLSVAGLPAENLLLSVAHLMAENRVCLRLSVAGLWDAGLNREAQLGVEIWENTAMINHTKQQSTWNQLKKTKKIKHVVLTAGGFPSVDLERVLSERT